jgi:hypothetical protein
MRSRHEYLALRSRAAPFQLDFSKNCRRSSGKVHLIWSSYFWPR